MKKKKMTVTLIVIAALLILFAGWVIWSNKALTLTKHSIEYETLPPEFDGFKIAHLSDLHNNELGKDNQKLINMLKKAGPDIIVMTGDMVDGYHPDASVTVDFAKKAMEIAPCYYVTGNHEEGHPSEAKALKDAFEEIGVTVLDNAYTVIEKDGARINIMGIKDIISVYSEHDEEIERKYISDYIDSCMPESGFTVLLSHRPQYHGIYGEKEIELTLCGHAHGGQFRLPFVGGIYAHGDLFPKYIDGIHDLEYGKIAISRGLGQSPPLFRFWNRPEVILITLNAK